MNKTKMFKKVICLVIALMMLMPSMPSSIVSAAAIPGEEGVVTMTAGPDINAPGYDSNDYPGFGNQGHVRMTKSAKWYDKANGIAEVTFNVSGTPVKEGVDAIMVVDRSGSMGYDIDPICINPEHSTCGGEIIWTDDGGTWDDTFWWGEEQYQRKLGTCVDCGATYEFISIRSRGWFSSWSSWTTPEPTVCSQEFDSLGNKITDKTDCIIADTRLEVAQQSARNFVNTMFANDDDGQESLHRVGLVSFNNGVDSTYNAPLTGVGGKNTLINTIGTLSANSGTDYNDALQAAIDMLEARTGEDRNRPAYIVFLTDGKPDPSDLTGRVQADAIKASPYNATIYSIGLMMDEQYYDNLEYIASDPDDKYFYPITAPSVLGEVFSSIAGQTKIAGTNASIDDAIQTVNFNGTVISAVATTGDSSISYPNVGSVNWDIGDITKGGSSLTVKIKMNDSILQDPDARGLYDTNAGPAILSYTNFLGNSCIQKVETPKLPRNACSINIVYYLVNENGDPISKDSNITGVVGWDNKEVLNNIVYNDGISELLLPNHPYTINASIPTFLDDDNTLYTYVPESAGRSGNPTTLASPVTVTMSEDGQSKTVYFGYKKTENVTVTFDKNHTDSEGWTDANPSSKETVKYSTLGTLPSEPTRAGYIFEGWNTERDGTGTVFVETTPVTESKTVYAQWEKDTSKWHTVTFYEGTNGSLTGKTVFTDILEGTTFTDAVTEPTVTADFGWTANGWDATIPATVETDLVFTQTYVKDTSKWHTVTFYEGTNGSLTGKTVFTDILEGTTFTDAVTEPTVAADFGWTANGWDATIPATVETDLVFTQTYVKDTSKWHTVTFYEGTNGSLTGKTVFTDILEGTTFTDAVTEPTVAADFGWTANGWDATIPATVETDLVFTQTYVKDTSKWHTVTFYEGTNGSLTGKTVFTDILEGTTFTDAVTEPTVTADFGWTANGWDATIPATVETDLVFTQTYVKDTSKWHTVTFYEGTNGSLTGKTVFTDILEGTTFTDAVTEPTVAADFGWTANGWDATIPATVETDLVFTQTYVKDTSKWHTVTFYEGTNGSLTGKTVFTDILEGTTFTDAVTEPTVTADFGWTANGWDATIPATVETDLVFTQTYVKDTSKWHTVTFYEGTNGSLTGKTVFTDILEGTTFTDAVTEPTVAADFGWTANGWDATIPATVETDLVFTQTYVKDTSKWHTVTFYEGTNGSLTGKTVFTDILEGTTFTDAVTEPTVTADFGWTANGWDATIPATVETDLVFTQTYVKDTSKWHTVTFYEGTNGSLTGKTVFTDILEGTTFTDAVTEPTVTADFGWTANGWDATIPATVETDLVFTQTYVKDTSKWHTVTFYEGTNGSLTGKTVFTDILEGTTFTDAVTEPTVTADFGWTANGWDATIPATVETDLVFTQTYVKDTSKWHTVTFYEGTNGSLTGKTVFTDILEGTTFTDAVTEPTVTADFGWTANGWDATIPATVETDLVFTQTYVKDTSKWHTVTFYEGTNGSLTGKTVFTDILEGTTFTDAVTEPTVTADFGWTANGWDATIPATVETDLVFTQTYVKDTSKWHTVTFYEGTNGSLTGKTVFTDILEGTTFTDAVTEPTVAADFGWTANGWDATIPATVETDLVFTQTYVKDTSKWHTVTFYEGTNGSLTGKTVFTDILEGTTFTDAVTEPTVTADFGWTANGWDVTIPATVETDLVFTQTYVKDTSKWHTVTFYEGTNGSLTGKTVFTDILEGTTFTDAVTEPTVAADFGWTANGWDATIPATVETDLVFTQTYVKDTSKWHTVTFYEGTNGSLTGKTVFTDILEGTTFTDAVTEPTVTADFGWTANGWDATIPATVETDLVFTQTYVKDTSKWHTVTFYEGTNGSLTGKTVFTDILEGTTFTDAVTEPTVAADFGWTANGWDATIPATVETDLVFTQTYVKDTSKWHTVTFYEGTNGSLTGKTVFTDILEGTTFTDAVTEPTVTADFGWTANGWDATIPATVETDLVFTQTYVKDTSKWHTVTFYEGTNGSLTGKTVFTDILEGTTFTDAVTEPTVTADFGWTANGWDATIPATVETDLVFTQTYVKDTSKWHTVTFYEGTNGSLTGKTVFTDILEGTTFTDAVTEPTVTADFGWTANGWDATIPATVETDLVFTQTYVKDTSKWHTVTFYEGTNGSLTGKTVFTDILEGTTFTDAVTEPTVTADFGWTANGWDATIPATVETDLVFTQTYVKDTSKWHTVTFYEGTNGSLTGKTVFTDILEGTTFTDAVTEPTVTADFGWTANGWDATIPATVETDLVFTQTYVKDTSKWHTVTFYEGTNGSLTGKTVFTDILEGTTFTDAVTEPTVTADFGWTANGWDATIPATVETDLVFTQTYVKDTSKWHTVTFYEGTNGSLTGKTVFTDILEGTTFTDAVTEPTVTADFGWTANGWDATIPATVETDLVFTQTYVKDTSKWHTVTFYEGTNGSLTGKTVFTDILEGTTFTDAVTEPTVTADFGWTANGWDATIPATVETDLVFTQTYVKDTSKWHTVTFVADENGSLIGTTVFAEVLNETVWADAVTVPTPVADSGYKFSGWTPSFPTIVTDSVTYIANFTAITIEIPVIKVWIGYEAETVDVNLLNGEEVVDTITLSGPEWTGTFVAPKYDGQGNEIQYTVEEVNIDGYISEVTKNEDGSYIVTNTETTDIHVRKDWVDDERPQVAMLMKSDEINTKPSITIRLWVGENEIDHMELKFPNETYDEVTFSNLPKFDSNGDYIDYRVTEDELEGYESVVRAVDGPYYIVITNTLKSYTVSYDANGGTGTTPDEVYKYGSPVETIVNPFEKAGNKFTGWNTKANGTGDSYDEEEIFQMPAEDVTLYAQWTPNTGISYTVYYVDEDTDTNLDSKVVGGKVFGDTVTESAIDFVGYVKQDPTSKSITLGESDNVMKFYYKVRTDIEYVVNYLESGTNKVLAEQKVVTGQTFGDEVTEYAIDIDGKNKVGRIEKTITLGVEDNIINFYYSDYEVIEESDFYTINWNYETGYNTYSYNQRYTEDGEGSITEDVTNYVQLHYDSGYTYSTYTTSTTTAEKAVIVDTTSGSAITGSAITGTAIVYETTTTLDLYYDKNRSKKPNKPVIIEDPIIPLAELEKLDHFAYVIGYPEGDVRPLNNITREEVAMIFYRLLTDESRNELLSDTNPFKDMTSDRWSNRAISTLYNAGILEGYLDGTFKPSDPISRAEFATIAAKFDKLELNNNSKFTDIAGHWAEKYITSSEVKGWIKGYEDNTFRPNQDITRAESMTLINNVLERAVPEENIHPDAMFWPDNLPTAWYYEAVEEATNSHDYIYEEDGDELWTGLKANKIWP